MRNWYMSGVTTPLLTYTFLCINRAFCLTDLLCRMCLWGLRYVIVLQNSYVVFTLFASTVQETVYKKVAGHELLFRDKRIKGYKICTY